MPLINFEGGKEGEFFLKWMKNRLIESNKNILSAELGPTGSGKSYRDLRKAELWYDYYFKEKFPAENICFGVANVMSLLSKGNLRRGEVIIVEEAGVNLGSRDWQSKISKMFNYVLQSFRSMNLALFMNLPYLSMLDSQARKLLHYYAESVTIDNDNKINICKPFFLQVAQSSGKPYRHYPKVKMNGRNVKIKKFCWSMPSKYIIDEYEKKKREYLQKLTMEYSDKLNPTGKIVVKEMREPTAREREMYNRFKSGEKMINLALEYNMDKTNSYVLMKKIEYYDKTHKNQEILVAI
jgi:hypothetical protein